MILGTMVARLPEDPGEHQLTILFGFLRTCAQIAQDFLSNNNNINFQQEVLQFIESPAFRTKDIISNLFVLLG